MVGEPSQYEQAPPGEIIAQVSLYPLRQLELAPGIDEALETLQQYELVLRPGRVSTMVSGELSTVFQGIRDMFETAAAHGDIVMVSTFSNACPRGEGGESGDIAMQPIGRVESQFDRPAAPDAIRESESRIILNPDLADGLKGYAPGDTLLVVFAFHRSEGYDLLQHPRGDQSRPPRGVFALRSPNRPNPIGITQVELLAVESNVLTVWGLDALNGTPVLDLKPA